MQETQKHFKQILKQALVEFHIGKEDQFENGMREEYLDKEASLFKTLGAHEEGVQAYNATLSDDKAYYKKYSLLKTLAFTSQDQACRNKTVAAGAVALREAAKLLQGDPSPEAIITTRAKEEHELKGKLSSVLSAKYDPEDANFLSMAYTIGTGNDLLVQDHIYSRGLDFYGNHGFSREVKDRLVEITGLPVGHLKTAMTAVADSIVDKSRTPTEKESRLILTAIRRSAKSGIFSEGAESGAEDEILNTLQRFEAAEMTS